MKKTLGGQRLGSGNRMTVELHNYERSTHDLSYLWRSTMSAGTLVPFLCKVALPGDTFDIHLNCDVKTHPTIGPLFGSFKVQLDLFQAPVRLYQGQLHNNKLGVGMNMSAIKLPLYGMTIPAIDIENPSFPDIDNCQVNPSALNAYLGKRGIGMNGTALPVNRFFNAIPELMYWETYKNYYANKQEEIGYCIHTEIPAMVTTVDAITNGADTIPEQPLEASVLLTNQLIINYTGTQPIPNQVMINTDTGRYSADQICNGIFIPDTIGTTLIGIIAPAYTGIRATSWQYRLNSEPIFVAPKLEEFPLSNIDDMRENILASTQDTTAVVLNNITAGAVFPYRSLYGQNGDNIPYRLQTQEGLGVKTYQSDLFNNWLQTEWIDGAGGITEITSIDTSGGSFSIDQLNLSKKIYDMLNRVAVSGGSYEDWIDAVYAHENYGRCESPMYEGGLIKELVFQEVVSNSIGGGSTFSGGTPEQPLGTLAGRGILSNKHKGGKAIIKVNEPSYIMGIVSLTPRIDYSQGNEWDVNLLTMDDFHKPALDEIGFQELITEQMAWWSTQRISGQWEQKSAGKQPAWINYMTSVNKTFGNFAIANNEMFMTLNRRYESNWPTSSNIVDLTTYIDPSKYNHIFAQTTLDAQNFWVQIAVDITARRKMSAKIMPNL